ncbi:UvrABC system protein A [Clostridium ragsdalei P11]|uniref:UvrABC system protein A n=1 Tax=Clostridium ragsdalei P11 TaxID=1353534 RepID=A0A1A6AT99_9CLOT|nr:excinuclease ABC subunit UvrA [Clostridium ragsdalei]OBR93304.1 UvrABC system protein A [Clostridium ragsdalei P11]
MSTKLRELIINESINEESEDNMIVIKGAKHHNLKNVSLKLPKNKLIVFTGVSGSGKSTLVFDIIHAEAQRRFIKGLSTFAKRSVGKIEKPKVEYISGLTPSLAIEQKSISSNPRSTVGTLTEISDYLRLLYSRIGIRTCENCKTEIKILLYKNKKSECPNCHTFIKPLMSAHFSSNTPQGMCPHCKGLGVTQEVDLKLLIGDESLSILDGAINWFGNLRENNKTTWPTGPLDIVFDHYNLDIETPWKDLPKSFQNVILYGSGEEKLEYPSIMGGKTTLKPVKGIVTELTRLYYETDSEVTRKKYAQFMSFDTCSVCKGTKLSKEANSVRIGKRTISEVSNMSVREALSFIKDVYEHVPNSIFKMSKEIILEIYKRLSFLNDVGLHYLSLNRSAPTLSGGEGQRVRLAAQLSSEITGITYVLDEPSTGLHPRDLENLVGTLFKLRDKGNTVIVVEHDEEIIKHADYIVDIGPYAGVLGGEIIAQGSLDVIKNNSNSLTGKYLSKTLKVNDTMYNNLENNRFLTIKGANLNNLRSITAHFRLNTLNVVTGVSGSGKSSLISRTLKPLLENLLNKADNKIEHYSEILGYEDLDKVINVSQEPIGRTPRSNPATYIGVFDKIRKVFANTKYAKKHHMSFDYFSFNSVKGRCPYCEGQGQIKIEMHFLPDVWIECDECGGRRFKEEVLKNEINGKNIADVLDMDANEASEFFKDYKDIHLVLEVLKEVGLGYIKLGQSATTLSGGEAQRVKLAKELSRKAKGKTVYIFDEPTNGLHFHDVSQLLVIFDKLLRAGHTLIVIEHNLDVIKAAGWIVDMGPEGGKDGGKVIVEGTLKDVINSKESFTGRAIRKTESMKNLTRC